MTETTQEQKTADAPKAVPAIKAILAKKLGMTRVYDATGEFIPVTVLEAGPCRVIQVKSPTTHGYAAVQVGFGSVKAKNLSKPETGHFEKKSATPVRWLREFRLKTSDGFEPGQEIRVDQFAVGDQVDVSGLIKGKGYAGTVKRHRFKGGPKTHGQSDRWRAPGSSGRERVWPGKRGPGHMGSEIKTVQRLEVITVNAEENLLLIRGSVPGPLDQCLKVYGSTRPRLVKKAAAPAAKKAAAKAAPAKAAKK